jgi:hypothetical protein
MKPADVAQNPTPMAMAWQQAAADLGFRFVSPYSFVDRAGRAVFMETLVDWGWHGPAGARPIWVSGR